MVTENSTKKPLLSNKAYDVVRNLGDLIVPGATAFYVTIAQIWGLAYGEEVAGTGVAITLFLGVLAKMSTRSYEKSDSRYDGRLVVEGTDVPPPNYSIETDGDIDELTGKDDVNLKVDHTEKDSQ